ncbi:hypothetical protein LTR05_005291 [Lithohypha guttulata]|uniref:ZIP family zinc transporter n=1 Tax=Lithohypha guttulata TaxID=1690604 RepID=A0AAN7SXI2_9EURO|nr:hypothetical protein LTR05_005291 [Lithohypha guttulata]
MLAVFVVFFAVRGAKHSHNGPFAGQWEGAHERSTIFANDHIPLTGVNRAVIDSPNVSSPMAQSESFQGDGDDEDRLDTLDATADESAMLNKPDMQNRHPTMGHSSVPGTQDPQKMLLQCLLLEAGILFHSIFIGMAVSVATGTAFVVLLIAICFHQTFEGFALGARIANLIPALFDARSPKPWIMCFAYGTTTPIGQILGLVLHRLYDPNSEAGLLTVGITNAISSGLLLFAGLVQLVAEDFLTDSSYKALKGKRRIEANLAVACGGLLMAIVGAFA